VVLYLILNYKAIFKAIERQFKTINLSEAQKDEEWKSEAEKLTEKKIAPVNKVTKKKVALKKKTSVKATPNENKIKADVAHISKPDDKKNKSIAKKDGVSVKKSVSKNATKKVAHKTKSSTSQRTKK